MKNFVFFTTSPGKYYFHAYNHRPVPVEINASEYFVIQAFNIN